jgi:dGTPase
MLNALADDLVTEIRRRVAEAGIQDLKSIRQAPQRQAAFSTEMEQLRREAKEFLYQNLYLCPDLQRAHKQASTVVLDLFGVWMADPGLLPAGYSTQIEQQGAPRVIADYLAGMTDHFVLEMHRRLRKAVPSRS